MNQNTDSFGLDQIQISQYPVIYHPSQEMSKEVFQAKGNLTKSIQTFLEKFNCIPFGENAKVLLHAWEKFFAIQHAQPEDTSELFQKLLEDLQIINKELAEYINSPKNSSNSIAASNSNQEKEGPPQDSDIRQLVREECGIKVCEEQKQNMEDTMLELLEVCRQKEFYCMHNDVDDLIESALNSKLFSINLRSQRLDKKKVKKSSTSLNNTSQISLVHAITPVLPTEEPKYSLKVTSDDESECDVSVKVESSLVFKTFSNPIFDDNDDFTSSDDESLSDEDVPMEDFKVYSNPLFDDEETNSDEIDPHYFNAESNFIESLSNHDTLFESSPKFDYIEEFSGALMPTSIVNEERIRRERKEYTSLMEKLLAINSFPHPLENFHANTIIETLTTSPIPVEDSYSQREEINIFTGTDDLLPPNIESDDYDSERDIHFRKELLVNDSIHIPENKSSNFDHHDDPLFPRPPPEPPDVEFFFDFEPNLGVVISVVMNNIDELNEDECFDPR
uniref:Reverse transcriptase domain-containing protein n=1 Tax=Tanacetum cinerariifolium TaxID=118510 RepID=A0A699GUE1_TANCI|nr:hypothetical protein [Tanacetum cinerariifolium]